MEKINLFTKYKDYMANLIELTNALKIANQTKQPSINFTSFRDDMIARKVHGLPVPERLETLTEKSDRYANIELSAIAEYKPYLVCLFIFQKNPILERVSKTRSV
jgi:hypothetical protein